MNLEKENTVTIDPATGFPQLPEGYFWEVKQYMKECRAGARGEAKWLSPDGYQVCIMTMRTTTTTTNKERWWDKIETVTKESKYAVRSARLIDPVKVAAADEEYARWQADTSAWRGFGYIYSDISYDYITPEIVLTAATTLYKEWQECLQTARETEAKRAASEALVGVYPPKVLP